MAKSEMFELSKDSKGVTWDALMYVPTVSGLGIGALMFWYDANQGLAYLLFFLACFFFYQGVHRVLGRMLVLPQSPVSLDVSRQRVLLKLRNGEAIELIKSVRFFSDHAGKSFGLTGMDMMGSKRQYVFHKGQFADAATFGKVTDALKVFA
ncbi:MAG: hypothetical protein GXP18_04495 [Gammaproteobacteria bacterium]|nr:hypothetical protein [Gammaproteobacteria bacterium]